MSVQSAITCGATRTISASGLRACRFWSSLLPCPVEQRSTGLACPLLFAAELVSCVRGIACTGRRVYIRKVFGTVNDGYQSANDRPVDGHVGKDGSRMVDCSRSHGAVVVSVTVLPFESRRERGEHGRGGKAAGSRVVKCSCAAQQKAKK
jgi:hypothetical protein